MARHRFRNGRVSRWRLSPDYYDTLDITIRPRPKDSKRRKGGTMFASKACLLRLFEQQNHCSVCLRSKRISPNLSAGFRFRTRALFHGLSLLYIVR